MNNEKIYPNVKGTWAYGQMAERHKRLRKDGMPISHRQASDARWKVKRTMPSLATPDHPSLRKLLDE